MNYERLTEFLKHQLSNEITLTFDDLEDQAVVGIVLPPPARTRRQWWENHVSCTGRQCYAWLSVGWAVKDVKLGQAYVVFGRSTLTFRIERMGRAGLARWPQTARAM